jgi:uncharacterized protein (DUF1778 family)
MSKTITVRLTENEYELIADCAKAQHRPISNFITSMVLHDIEESMYADSIEMAQITNDKNLMEKIKKGQSDAENKKGRFVE